MDSTEKVGNNGCIYAHKCIFLFFRNWYVNEIGKVDPYLFVFQAAGSRMVSYESSINIKGKNTFRHMLLGERFDGDSAWILWMNYHNKKLFPVIKS